ncbi:MAG: hypothetical protein KIT83_01980 [Bryobacterales bacterium]|nr:hypothetical protein [Bryobacterales bacterium]
MSRFRNGVKRSWHVVACGAMAVVFVLSILGPAGVQMTVDAALASTPEYTARFVERAVDADGTERFRFDKTYAVRADRTTVVAEHRHYRGPEGQPLQLRVRHLSDPNRKVRVSVYPDVAGRVTVGLRNEAVEALKAVPQPSCTLPGFETVVDPNRAEILGHSVLRRERQLESSDGLHTGPEQVEWVAPSLGCLALHSELRAYEQGGRLRGTVVREASGVEIGSPAVELFEVDQALVEMMPSEIMAAQNRLQGLECSKCDETAAANGDRMYLANRPLER